jgi:hypothetical protein
MKHWVLIHEEAIFLVHTSPWETEFINTAFGISEMPGQEREPPKRVAQHYPSGRWVNPYYLFKHVNLSNLHMLIAQ